MALLVFHRIALKQPVLNFPDQFGPMVEQEKVVAGENPCVAAMGAFLRPAVELGQGDMCVVSVQRRR